VCTSGGPASSGRRVELERADDVRVALVEAVPVRDVVDVPLDRRLHVPLPHRVDVVAASRGGAVGDEDGVRGHPPILARAVRP